MATERRKYTDEFKKQVVSRLIGGDITQSSLSKELGICSNILGRWKRESEAQRGWARGQAAKDSVLAELKKDKKIRELEMEIEILKKASAYFARHVR